MVLNLNEMKRRAYAFVHEWTGEEDERAEAQTFWNEFFDVFGISRSTSNYDDPYGLVLTTLPKKFFVALLKL